MSKVHCNLFISLLACVASATFQDRKEAPRAPAGEDKLDALPAAVRAAAIRWVGAGTIVAADKETEAGCVAYEVNARTRDGVALSFTLSESGELMIEERGIEVERLPQPVADALTARFPKARVLRAETLIKHRYEVVVEVDGKKREVEVMANGMIETPAAKSDGEESEHDEQGKEGEAAVGGKQGKRGKKGEKVEKSEEGEAGEEGERSEGGKQGKRGRKDQGK